MGQMTPWRCNQKNTDCENLCKTINLFYQQINCKGQKGEERQRNIREKSTNYNVYYSDLDL